MSLLVEAELIQSKQFDQEVFALITNLYFAFAS